MDILLILAFWVGNTFRIPLFINAGVSMLDVAMVVICFWSVSYIWKHKHILREQVLFKKSAYFIGAAFISLLLAVPLFPFQEICIAGLYLVRLMCYMSLLFIPIKISYGRIRLIIVGSVVIGFLQYFLYPNLRYLLYMGWDDHYLRLFGSLMDPNFMGALLVLMLITLLWRPDGKKSTWVDYVLWCITLIALLLTYSRSAFITLCITATAAAVAQKKLVYIALISAVFVTGIFFLPKNLPSEGVNLLRTASIHARQEEYKKALEIYKTHPLFGVGYNTYRSARLSIFGPETSPFPSHAAAGVPNSYLFILTTTGVVGFFFFIMWLGALWKEFSGRSRIAVPLLVAYFCSGLFDNGLVYPFIMCWVFLILKQTEFANESNTYHKSNAHVRNAK